MDQCYSCNEAVKSVVLQSTSAYSSLLRLIIMDTRGEMVIVKRYDSEENINKYLLKFSKNKSNNIDEGFYSESGDFNLKRCD